MWLPQQRSHFLKQTGFQGFMPLPRHRLCGPLRLLFSGYRSTLPGDTGEVKNKWDRKPILYMFISTWHGG
jgi:hypothetical protein